MPTFFIIILIIIFILISIYFALNSKILAWDEYVYLGNARGHLTTSYHTEDFRFPLLEYLISVVWLVTGENVLIAQFMMILISTALIYIFYLTLREYTEHSGILLAGFAFSPLLVFWGFRVYSDILSILLVSISFLLILKKSDWPDFLSGIFAGLGFLARFPLGLFSACTFFYHFYKRSWRRLLLFSSGIFSALLPWLLWNFLKYRNPIWDFQQQYLAVAKWSYWQPITLFLQNLVVHASIMVVLFFIGVYFLLRTKPECFEILIAYPLLSIIYYCFFVNLKDPRYIISFMPFFYIVGMIGAERTITKIKSGWWRKIVIGLVVIILIAPSAHQVKVIENSIECSKKYAGISGSIAYIDSHTANGDYLLTNYNWPMYAYEAKVNATSLYDSNLSYLVRFHNAEYVVFSNYGELYKLDYSMLEKVAEFKECSNKIEIYRVKY